MFPFSYYVVSWAIIAYFSSSAPVTGLELNFLFYLKVPRRSYARLTLVDVVVLTEAP